MAVNPDILEAEVVHTAEGTTITRTHQVTGLSGASESRMLDASRVSGIPRVGDPHPRDSSALVEEVRANSTDDPAVALVRIRYRKTGADSSGDTGGWRVSVSTDFVVEETSTDIAGNLIRSYYTNQERLFDPATGALTRTTETTTASRTHRVEVQRPTFTLTFEREQPQRFTLQRVIKFAGSINADSFQGAPPDRWLCRIGTDEESNGNHRVRLSFTYSRTGWQPRVVFYDAQRLIPEEVREGNGINLAQVYVAQSYASLGLPRV